MLCDFNLDRAVGALCLLFALCIIGAYVRDWLEDRASRAATFMRNVGDTKRRPAHSAGEANGP